MRKSKTKFGANSTALARATGSGRAEPCNKYDVEEALDCIEMAGEFLVDCRFEAMSLLGAVRGIPTYRKGDGIINLGEAAYELIDATLFTAEQVLFEIEQELLRRPWEKHGPGASGGK